jgi:hypothetical protein
VYGGTPPDGGVANRNEYTVADAIPAPGGEVPMTPGSSCGTGIVVVVVVVCVTVTVPSVWSGDPVQATNPVARNSTIGSRLRTDM